MLQIQNYQNSLSLIKELQHSYYDLMNVPLEELKYIKDKFNSNLSKNNITFVGEIPTHTLYNFKKINKQILDIDEDSFALILGKPGLGKSNISILSSFFLDSDFNSNRIIFTFEELISFLKLCSDELIKEKDSDYTSYLRGSKLIIDEGVDIFFSADANTKKGKLITKLLTVVRFLNLFVFVNATNYEKLNKTLRESRLRVIIKINRKGNISFFSPLKTSQVSVNSQNIAEFPEPSFSENVGYIDKNNDFWKSYNFRKSTFVSNTILEIQNLLEDNK